jgi:hypothetical protein
MGVRYAQHQVAALLNVNQAGSMRPFTVQTPRPRTSTNYAQPQSLSARPPGGIWFKADTEHAMDTKFVMFKGSRTNKPVLINIDHVRTAFESGSGQVKLVMGSGAGGEDYQEVDGDLKSVWEKLEPTPPVPPIEE